jgi:signal transduction histidine kinase
VDDLLDVSRLRAGRLQVRRERVDLVDICRTIIESKRTTVDTHQFALETTLSSLAADVDGDRIHQVIDNLVGNAIKYTESGRITLRLEEVAPGGDVRIQVSDQGRGITAKDREALFTPFYRTRSASESAVPGLGLGLYICRELIQAHDGTITVDDAPGGGARFTIVLPRPVPASDRLTA